MAEHERKGQKKQEKVEQKHRVRQQESEPVFDHFHAWEQGTLSIGETPFLPRMDEHAELLARAPSDNQRANIVLQLQQTYGNRYVQRLIESRVVQAKLKVSAPNDIYEQEADRVAKAVTRADKSQVQRQVEEEEEEEPLQTKLASEVQRQEEEAEEEEEEPLQTKLAPEVQRQEEEPEEEEEEPVQTKLVSEVQRQEEEPEEEEEEPVQTKAVGSQAATVSEDLEVRIKAERGGGHPLSDNTREPMEQSFGADFSGVRVHTDSEADALNKQLSAKAFTTGQDVFFRENEYSPGSDSGRELIAHELTHVVQQTGGQLQRIPTIQRDNGEGGKEKGGEITEFPIEEPERPRRPRRTRKPGGSRRPRRRKGLTANEAKKRILTPKTRARIKSKIEERSERAAKALESSVPSEDKVEDAKKKARGLGEELEDYGKKPEIIEFALAGVTEGAPTATTGKAGAGLSKLNTEAGRKGIAGTLSEWIGWIEQFVETPLEIAKEAGAAMSKAAAEVAGNVLGAFGTVLTAISATFDIRAMFRTHKRIQALNAVLKEARNNMKDKKCTAEEKELLDFLVYAINQKCQKMNKRLVSVISGITSGGIGLAAIFAGVSLVALASNPVGWVIAGAVAALAIGVGLGLLIYKIGRAIWKKFVKKSKGKKRHDMAERLFNHAILGGSLKDLACKAINALALSWVKMDDAYNKEAKGKAAKEKAKKWAVDLIAEKLASA